MHGFSVNVAPELSHFSGIVPCGIGDHPVTSLDEMGMTNVQTRFDLALMDGFQDFLFSLEAGRGKG
jgi:lipoyl(octanoyl) transferase